MSLWWLAALAVAAASAIALAGAARLVKREQRATEQATVELRARRATIADFAVGPLAKRVSSTRRAEERPSPR